MVTAIFACQVYIALAKMHQTHVDVPAEQSAIAQIVDKQKQICVAEEEKAKKEKKKESEEK